MTGKYKILILIAVITILQFRIGNAQVSHQEGLSISYTPGHYGDHCLYPSQCDANSKLSCVEGICRCSSEYEIYDSVREQCAIREGQRCSPPKFFFGENNPCVSNAYCSESRRTCECEAHAFPDSNSGSCIRKKSYNDSCAASTECDDLKYLSCVEGLCSCRLSTFDEYHQICRRKIGDACARTKDCVQNSECLNGKCACNIGYSATAAKTCGLSYSKPCGVDGDQAESCSDIYFACVNGECRWYFLLSRIILTQYFRKAKIIPGVKTPRTKFSTTSLETASPSWVVCVTFSSPPARNSLSNSKIVYKMPSVFDVTYLRWASVNAFKVLWRRFQATADSHTDQRVQCLDKMFRNARNPWCARTWNVNVR